MANARVLPLPLGGPNAVPLSDEELVVAARAGDRRAKDALIRRHLDMVRRLAFRLTAHESDLEDLVQDAFVIALNGLDRLRDPALFPAWLRSVTIYEARHRLRRERLLRRLGLRHHAQEPEALAVASPGAPPDASAELSRVYSALRRINSDCQVAFVLVRLEGLSLVDAANEMKISLSTVKRRLHQADAEIQIQLARARGSKP